MQLNCDVIDGSIVKGLRKPVLFSFVLDKDNVTFSIRLKQFNIEN